MSSRKALIVLPALLQCAASLFLSRPAVAEEGALLRIVLDFGKGREVRIVPRGDALKASAEIILPEDTPGSVSGSWAVAGPMSPRDKNAFFKNISEFHDENPGGTVLETSPVLPTDHTGSYAVRLSVTTEAGEKKDRIIKYFVGEKPSRDLLGGKTEVPEVLQSVSPKSEEAVTRETILSWDAVPGSLAYQVELFDKTGDEQGIVSNPRVNACIMRLASSLNRPPLVGLMVPAYKNETTVGEVSGGSDLTRGSSYLWRVVAIDRDGRELCESPLREFVFSGTP